MLNMLGPAGPQTGPIRPAAWSGPVRLSALSVAALLPLAALRLRDPHLAGSWGACPVLTVTGAFCPGCGALRALNDLAHGDLPAAVASNALLVLVGLPVLLGSAIRWVRRREQPTYPTRAYAGFGLLLVAFTVARNLPGSALAP